MKLQAKKIVLIVASVACTFAHSVPAIACDGGGGRSFSSSYSRPAAFHRAAPARAFSSYGSRVSPQAAYAQSTTYTQPSYQQSTYSQPTYSQPTCTQPTYSQSAYAQPAYSRTRQAIAAPTTARTTAPVAKQSTTPVSIPANNSVARAANPVPKPAPAPTPTPAKTNNGNVETNALAMLASLAAKKPAPINEPGAESLIPEFTTASARSTTHVGTWSVALPGNQSVQLSLKSDSTFEWTATKAGKTSKFDGQYRLANGRLTLVRSADLQQMAGSWTGTENKFTFKLDGAKNSGLNFRRS